jgi:hypothetical protein
LVDGALRAVVQDDGLGGATLSPGGGLAGLVGRLAAVGGWLDVRSAPGGGTQVRIQLASVRADVVCTVHLGFVRGVLQRLQEVAGAAGRVPHGIEPDLVRLKPVLDGSGPCLLTLPLPRVAPRTG